MQPRKPEARRDATHAGDVGTAASRPPWVALEARLKRGEADALATRIPALRRMLARGVLFFRDSRDREDLDAALGKLADALASNADPFDVADWPPRPAPRKRKPWMNTGGRKR